MEPELSEAAKTFLAEWGPPRLEPLRAFQADLAALLEAVRAEAAPRWVRTAEGLPAEGVEVLVRTVGGARRVAAWHGAYWAYLGESWPRDWATHWTPLPPGPPEGGEADDN